MSEPQHCAVIDIGKTNAKLVLVDMGSLEEVKVLKCGNKSLQTPPYPHYNTDALWDFILGGLQEFNEKRRIDAICVTTHGASAALLDQDGELVLPILDYEHDGPEELVEEYQAVRPPFSQTGSPRLPLGLNLGAQLFWQFKKFEEARARTRTLLTYPQYWVFRLTGNAVNEVTSLGCHTDLWLPYEQEFSSLATAMNWRHLMAPVAKASDQIGTLLPELARKTGVDPTVPVFCGIHDSNASLYAHLVSRSSPFAVVSTGTWVITMVIGGRNVELDPARDTLLNVNALGNAVPSARFLGGREFEIVMDALPHDFAEEDITRVLEQRICLLPSVDPGSGPFKGKQHRWTVAEETLTAAQKYVATSFYLALMTATGLEMTGAQGPVLVEGPFSENTLFLEMLATAFNGPVGAVKGTGTSLGAALLTIQGTIPPRTEPSYKRPKQRMKSYVDIWRRLAS